MFTLKKGVVILSVDSCFSLSNRTVEVIPPIRRTSYYSSVEEFLDIHSTTGNMATIKYKKNGCEITVPFECHIYILKSEKRNFSIKVNNKNTTKFPTVLGCEQEYFKYIYILSLLRNGCQNLDWKFFRPSFIDKEKLETFRLSTASLFDQESYSLNSLDRIITALECFVNCDLESNLDPAEIKSHDSYRFILFKKIWFMLYDEHSVSEQMAKKIEEAIFINKKENYSYAQIQSMLAEKFGSAGEGAVMTVAKLLSGMPYSVKSKTSIALFELVYPVLESNMPDKIHIQEKKSIQNLKLKNEILKKIDLIQTQNEKMQNSIIALKKLFENFK